MTDFFTDPVRPAIRNHVKGCRSRRLRRQVAAMKHGLLSRLSGTFPLETITGIKRQAYWTEEGIEVGNLRISDQAIDDGLTILAVYRYVDWELLFLATNANSALLGLIWTYLRERLDKVVSFTKVHRLYLIAPQIWLAGVNTRPTDLRLIDEGGLDHILVNFSEVCNSKHLRRRLEETGFLAILDSDGFKEWMKQRKKTGITANATGWAESILDGPDGWSAFLKRQLHRWAAFVRRNRDLFVLCVQPDDPLGGEDVNWQLLKWSESQGLTPWPVYHVGMSLAYIDRLHAADYPGICIGGHVGVKGPQLEERLVKLQQDLVARGCQLVTNWMRDVPTKARKASVVLKQILAELRAYIRRHCREHVLGAFDKDAWSSDCSSWLEARRNGAFLTDEGQKRLWDRTDKAARPDWITLTRANLGYIRNLLDRLSVQSA